MPRKNLFKFLSRKFAKVAKEDDAPTYRKHLPDFSFLEGFDNMSVILDAGPAEQATVDTVEEAREETRSDQEATVTPTLEPQTAENTSSEPAETVDNTPVEPERTLAVLQEPEATETTPKEPETTETTPAEAETVPMEVQATESVPMEPETTETAQVKEVPTRMNLKNWTRLSTTSINTSLRYGRFVEEATVDLSTIQEEEIQEAGLDPNDARCDDELASDVSIQSEDYFESETVTLQIESVRPRTLGFTVVGYSSYGVDHGIFVGCVERGGAAHLSGKIQPGHCIFGVNGFDLTEMTNEEALKRLRKEMAKGRNLTLEIGNCWDYELEE